MIDAKSHREVIIIGSNCIINPNAWIVRSLNDNDFLPTLAIMNSGVVAWT